MIAVTRNDPIHTFSHTKLNIQNNDTTWFYTYWGKNVRSSITVINFLDFMEK